MYKENISNLSVSYELYSWLLCKKHISHYYANTVDFFYNMSILTSQN